MRGAEEGSGAWPLWGSGRGALGQGRGWPGSRKGWQAWGGAQGALRVPVRSRVCHEQTCALSRHLHVTTSQAPGHSVLLLALPGAHVDCGPAGPVSHFGHQLPESPRAGKDIPFLRDEPLGTLRLRDGGRGRGRGGIPGGECMETPCESECVAAMGAGRRVNSHCPVLSAAVARYTGLFGQLPCLSVC